MLGAAVRSHELAEEEALSFRDTRRSTRLTPLGTCSDSLLGAAEAYWRPRLAPRDLARVAARCVLAALARDCSSGLGTTVTPYWLSAPTLTFHVVATGA
jgi:hypothetical protein